MSVGFQMENSLKICLQLTFSFVHSLFRLLVWGPTTRSLFIPTFYFTFGLNLLFFFVCWLICLRILHKSFSRVEHLMLYFFILSSSVSLHSVYKYSQFEWIEECPERARVEIRVLVRKTFGIKIEKYVQIETEIKKYTRAKKKVQTWNKTKWRSFGWGWPFFFFWRLNFETNLQR